MQAYIDTETNEQVMAEQYIGFGGAIRYESAIIYLNNTDWLIVLDDGRVTGYTNDIFTTRFQLVV